MLLELSIALLLICTLAYVGLGLWASRARRRLGLNAGRIDAADDSRLRCPTLRSERLGLVARPDHVLDLDGMRIPVEQKPSAQRAWLSHVLQVGVQCVLLEETYGVRPTHGVLVLAGGRQERVPFTVKLEHQLTETVRRMRHVLASNEAPGPSWVRGKCASCGYRRVCWGAGDKVSQTPPVGPS